MVESRLTRVLLRVGAGITLAFIYIPLFIIGLYAFNAQVAGLADRGLQHQVVLCRVPRRGRAGGAEALGLRSTRSHGDRARAGDARVDRRRALPILRTRGDHLRRDPADRPPRRDRARAAGDDHRRPRSARPHVRPTTIIIGHATFCVVVVYNNVIARMRRTAGNLDEASADLGADNWQTFRFVMLPQMRTALLAGALLAFALSFDEVIVTIFTSGAQQTLPIWIFAQLCGRRAPHRQRRRSLRDPRLDHPGVFATRLAGGAGLTADRPARGGRCSGRGRAVGLVSWPP